MLIKLQDICKSYSNEIGNINREVLKNLSLEIQQGDRIAIMGPSGSGKTTLLNLLGTLDKPDIGEIFIGDNKLSLMSHDETLSFRNKKAGFVFQFHHLLPQCTLLENVLLPTLAAKHDKQAATHRAEELLKFMGIWEQRNNKPGELSGGECQRAAVARALINQPDILLADEPTGSLDTDNAKLLMQLFININKEMGITLVIATHSHEIAQQMNKTYTIADGKLT
jgi:lipoprotein-releasing system ATP-binding protein